MNFNNLIMVNMTITKSTIDNFVWLAKIVAANIGKVAFLEPEIEIVPDNSFLPLINNFCIESFKFLEE